jgi:AAA ATPase domain
VEAVAANRPTGRVRFTVTRSAAREPHPALYGRTRECALLDGLIADIRQGESRSVVLRGEAGIGKTALLDYLIESGSDLTVVRAAGVESEMELAYSGLQRLLVVRLYDRETVRVFVGEHECSLAER